MGDGDPAGIGVVGVKHLGVAHGAVGALVVGGVVQPLVEGGKTEPMGVIRKSEIYILWTLDSIFMSIFQAEHAWSG